MITIKRSRLYALGAVNFVIFALIVFVASCEADPKEYLNRTLLVYAVMQIFLVTGWGEDNKTETKERS